MQKGDNPSTERGSGGNSLEGRGHGKGWHLSHKPRDTGDTPCTPMPATAALSMKSGLVCPLSFPGVTCAWICK